MNYFHFNNSYSTNSNTSSSMYYYTNYDPPSTECYLHVSPTLPNLNVLLALCLLLHPVTFTSNSSIHFYTLPAILSFVLVKHLFQFHSFLRTPLFPPLKKSTTYTKNITIYYIKKVHIDSIQFIFSKPDYILLTTNPNILTTKLFLTTRTPYT